jgi:hypothetical protein
MRMKIWCTLLPPLSKARKENQPSFEFLALGSSPAPAEDDPSVIGTYVAAGATIGASFLWTAVVTFPMMFMVVYLSAKSQERDCSP